MRFFHMSFISPIIADELEKSYLRSQSQPFRKFACSSAAEERIRLNYVIL
jgi:hypothetical protein